MTHDSWTGEAAVNDNGDVYKYLKTSVCVVVCLVLLLDAAHFALHFTDRLENAKDRRLTYREFVTMNHCTDKDTRYRMEKHGLNNCNVAQLGANTYPHIEATKELFKELKIFKFYLNIMHCIYYVAGYVKVFFIIGFMFAIKISHSFLIIMFNSWANNKNK